MHEILSPSLASLTTLRLGGKAIALLLPEKEEDLELAEKRACELGGTLSVIGKGSNLLARDGDLSLVLLSMEKWTDLEICDDGGDFVIVAAGAGVSMPRLLRFCLSNGLTGLEGLAGIPGSVGGACAMNAGSFGCETGARLHSIQIFTRGNLECIERKDLNFGYRSVKMKENKPLPLVVRAKFALTRGVKNDIFSRMNLNFMEKKSRQPVTSWSAGCAFKNPPEAPSAGKLLEDAGFRGKTRGGMAFSEKHANFLINTGPGTSASAFALLEEAAEAVWKKSGIHLEPEIRMLK